MAQPQFEINERVVEERARIAPHHWLTNHQMLEKYTPSRLYDPPLSYQKESNWLQLLCIFIEDAAHGLELTQQVINIAIVLLRRFFLFTPLQIFNEDRPRLQVVAATCLCVAAKAEYKARPLDIVIRWKEHLCGKHLIDQNGALTEGVRDDYVRMEGVLLRKLGFDLDIDHPHTHVVKACQTFRGNSTFVQSAYLLASCSLQMTPLCLLYTAPEVAAACIRVAMEWSRLYGVHFSFQVVHPDSGIVWYRWMVQTLTLERLNSIADVLFKAFRNDDNIIRKILDPQRYQAESRQRRGVHIRGFFHEHNTSLPLVIASRAPPRPSRSPGSSGSSSQSRWNGQGPQPGPSGARPATESADHSRPRPSGTQPRKPQQQSVQKVTGSSLGATASTSASCTSTQSAFMPPPAVTASIRPSSTLQEYNQRVQQSAQAKAEDFFYPMHPPIKQSPLSHLKTSSSRPYPQGHGDPNKPLPSTSQQARGDGQSQPMPVSHSSGQSLVPEPAPTPMASPSSSQDRTGRQQRPLAQPVKREAPVRSVPSNMHVKEAKGVVHNPLDARGKENARYINAEASRKRSYSQSMEEDGDASRQTPGESGDSSQAQYLKLSQDKTPDPDNHSMDASLREGFWMVLRDANEKLKHLDGSLG